MLFFWNFQPFHLRALSYSPSMENITALLRFLLSNHNSPMSRKNNDVKCYPQSRNSHMKKVWFCGDFARRRTRYRSEFLWLRQKSAWCWVILACRLICDLDVNNFSAGSDLATIWIRVGMMELLSSYTIIVFSESCCSAFHVNLTRFRVRTVGHTLSQWEFARLCCFLLIEALRKTVK